MANETPNVYKCRELGIQMCNTQGSEHYKNPGALEPLDLIIAQGNLVGFAIGSIQKYAGRYSNTRNIKDLIKIADYAQILVGYVTFEAMKDQKPLEVPRGLK